MPDNLNVSRTKWVDYERGKASPPIETVFQIAEFFQVDPKDLVFTDLENAQLTENRSVQKRTEKAQVNSQGNAQLTPLPGPQLASRQEAERVPLWALGMLHKLEQMAADIEALKKDDANAESRVGAA